jgi:hypothetical protein
VLHGLQVVSGGGRLLAAFGGEVKELKADISRWTEIPSPRSVLWALPAAKGDLFIVRRPSWSVVPPGDELYEGLRKIWNRDDFRTRDVAYDGVRGLVCQDSGAVLVVEGGSGEVRPTESPGKCEAVAGDPAAGVLVASFRGVGVFRYGGTAGWQILEESAEPPAGVEEGRVAILAISGDRIGLVRQTLGRAGSVEIRVGRQGGLKKVDLE